MKIAATLLAAGLAAGFAPSALAAAGFGQSDCALAEASRRIAIETRRFQAPAPQPGLEDTARLLGSSPCQTRSEPRLLMDTVDLGLLAEDWRRGTRELEQKRLGR